MSKSEPNLPVPSTVKHIPTPDPFPTEFRFIRRLGAGGFGEVWLAEDLNIPGRQVALKTIRLSAPSLDRVLAALRLEAATLAGLRHPNLVQLYGWRTSGPNHYLLLQNDFGGSLADCLSETRTLPWQTAGGDIADTAELLLAVHARGIVHRDIKPANILLDPETDEAILTDFGVAARLSDAPSLSGTRRYMCLRRSQARSRRNSTSTLWPSRCLN